MKYNSKDKESSYASAFKELIELIKVENHDEVKESEKSGN